PRMKCWDFTTPEIAWSICAAIVWYCRVRSSNGTCMSVLDSGFVVRVVSADVLRPWCAGAGPFRTPVPHPCQSREEFRGDYASRPPGTRHRTGLSARRLVG